MISPLACSSSLAFCSMLRILVIDVASSLMTPFTVCSVLSICSFCRLMISCVCVMVSTTFSELSISVLTIFSILPLAVLDCSARFWIWDATTAKPLPASPALAASMLAFRESRLVSDAISEINWEAFRIFCADSFVWVVCSEITETASFTFSLISFSASIVCAALSLDSFMESALSFSSSASFPVSMMRFPMCCALAEAFFAPPACVLAPSVISETVCCTVWIDA